MKQFRGWMVCGLVVAAGASLACAQDADNQGRRKLEFDRPKPLVLEHDMGAHGMLVLDVNVGDVRVARNPEAGKVEIQIQPQHFDSDEEVRGWVRQFDVAGDRATIRVHLPKHHRDNGQTSTDAEVVIYVPAETDVKADLGVGDLRITHVRGNKTLHVGIGDLTVGVEDASEYGSVESAVKIGDVHDDVDHVERSGFFGSETRHSGSGTLHLRASVGIGDVKIEQEDKL
jgi:hypothetical protein